MSEIATWYAGRKVVVTGCASGIGAALTALLADAGAKVIGLDYREPKASGIDYRAIDLRDSGAIERVAGAIEGPIDGLFNCAGITAEMGFEPIDVMRVNFMALRSLSEALLPKIANGGAITSIASFAGRDWRNAMPQINALLETDSFAAAEAWTVENSDAVGPGYILSKQAVVVWTMREAARTIAQGVRMNATSPGPVRTALMDAVDPTMAPGTMQYVSGPLGRYTKPEEQVEALFFLGSGAALAINGVVLPVDGGLDGLQSSMLR